jgi:hypothetical protein
MNESNLDAVEWIERWFEGKVDAMIKVDTWSGLLFRLIIIPAFPSSTYLEGLDARMTALSSWL